MAEAAGVSVATVSRALRGLDGVSPQTRERVRRAAAELDYLASPTAISLASGRTRTVGVVAPVLTRWLFAALASSVERAVRELGYHPLLLDLEGAGTPDSRLLLSRDLLWKRVDGLIALHVALTEREVLLLRRLDLPVTTIGAGVRGWPGVGADPEAAGCLGAEHLLRLGHVEIACVAGGPGAEGTVEGFRRALLRHGLTAAPSRVVSCPPTPGAGARAVLPMLSGRRPPTAVVAGCDELAVGVLAAARRRGLRVPADLSVVGTDDHPFAEALGLTTIRQDVEAQGRVAAAMLLRRIGDAAGTRAAETVVVPRALVVRESTGPPPPAGPRHRPPQPSPGGPS